jgi:head-tail adaptor
MAIPLAKRLKHRIRFEKLGPPPGDPTDPRYDPGADTWNLAFLAWAEVLDVVPSRSEAVKNGLRLAKDSARVRLRVRKDVTAEMRIVELYGARRTLSIVGGPAVIEAGRVIELLVEGYSS